MPKFNQGDKVTVNGLQATIQSWPDDDNGFFSATSGDDRVGVTWHNGHTTTMTVESGQVHQPADVQLVAAGGPADSTAGEVPDDGFVLTAEAVGTVEAGTAAETGE